MLAHEVIVGNDDDIAYYEGEDVVTCGRLRAGIAFCRARLYAAGVRKGDRVAICSRNSVDFVYAYLGIVSLGAIVVPVNFQLSLREKAYILQNAEVHLMFSDEKQDFSSELADYEGGLEVWDIALAGEDSGAAAVAPGNIGDNDRAAIIYTSGTTGFPKGAVLSHWNIVANAIEIRDILQLKRHDRALCVLPLYHCFAWTVNIMGVLLSGAETVMLDSFAPKETVEIIREKGVTSLFVVPSVCALLTRFARPEDMKTIRLTVIGGTALPEKVAEDYKTKFGLEILEGYGLSECSPVVSVNPPGQVRYGSIGKPLSNTVVRTQRSDGTIAAAGEPGELLVKSPSVMQGYWKLPEESKAAIEARYVGALRVILVACFQIVF